MLTNPRSRSFTCLIGLLSCLPTFGIDMILPSLSATGASLGVTASNVGSAMSVYLLGLGASLIVYGPVSDRFGRKPIVVFGSSLLVVASGGCFFARTLPQLLFFRVLQGIGAAGPGIAAVAIVRDSFKGQEARDKMSYVVFAVNIVPLIAPSVGAAMLGLGSWRLIYIFPAVAGLILLIAMSRFPETARINPNVKLRSAKVVRDYLRVLANPVCLGNILCNAAAAGAVFAYITGSSLLFISGLGLSPSEYGLIFGASSLSVMAGSMANGRLGRLGVSPDRMVVIGLVASTCAAATLVAMTLYGGSSITAVVLAMVSVALSFGLIAPNAMNAALEPMPAMVGSVSALMAFTQMLAAGAASELVSRFFDGSSAMAMAVVMLLFCVLSSAAFAFVAAPQPRNGKKSGTLTNDDGHHV